MGENKKFEILTDMHIDVLWLAGFYGIFASQGPALFPGQKRMNVSQVKNCFDGTYLK